MREAVYSPSTRELAQTRRELAPEAEAAFRAFSQRVFKDGTLSSKVKQLIAVAVAHVTPCPYCSADTPRPPCARAQRAKRSWRRSGLAAEMRAGAAYAHSALAIEEMEKAAAKQG